MNVILFIGFFLSYVNILHYSIPLGIGFLFSVILINLCIYYIYYKFFTNYKKDIQNEKELLFFSCLKNKDRNENLNEIRECSICYEETSIKKLYELNCSCVDKFYHQDCLKQWLCKGGSCPFCRKKMYETIE